METLIKEAKCAAGGSSLGIPVHEISKSLAHFKHIQTHHGQEKSRTGSTEEKCQENGSIRAI